MKTHWSVIFGIVIGLLFIGHASLAVGLEIQDGYGQTETGQLTGMPATAPVRPGSMGKPLPGFAMEVLDERGQAGDEGELVEPALSAGWWAIRAA